MNRRPESVLVVAVLCIFFGAIAFVGTLMYLASNDYPMWSDPVRADDLNIIKVTGAVDSLVTLVCGFNFLSGENWARWLFLIEGIISCAICGYLATDTMNALVTTIVFRAICVVILFLPASNQFFLFHDRKGR